jgi:hypothetical protein
MIKSCKKPILCFLICLGLLSFGVQGFSKTRDSISTEAINSALLGQIQKLSEYQKNAKVVQYLELDASSSELAQTRCTRFWKLFDKPKQIQIPIPIFARTGDSGKIAAADLMYEAALNNKKNLTTETNSSKENFQKFFEIRKSKNFAVKMTVQTPDDDFFDKEKFYDSLISLRVNPFGSNLILIKPFLTTLKYNPYYIVSLLSDKNAAKFTQSHIG